MIYLFVIIFLAIIIITVISFLIYYKIIKNNSNTSNKLIINNNSDIYSKIQDEKRHLNDLSIIIPSYVSIDTYKSITNINERNTKVLNDYFSLLDLAIKCFFQNDPDIVTNVKENEKYIPVLVFSKFVIDYNSYISVISNQEFKTKFDSLYSNVDRILEAMLFLDSIITLYNNNKNDINYVIFDKYNRNTPINYSLVPSYDFKIDNTNQLKQTTFNNTIISNSVNQVTQEVKQENIIPIVLPLLQRIEPYLTIALPDNKNIFKLFKDDNQLFDGLEWTNTDSYDKSIITKMYYYGRSIVNKNGIIQYVPRIGFLNFEDNGDILLNVSKQIQSSLNWPAIITFKSTSSTDYVDDNQTVTLTPPVLNVKYSDKYTININKDPYNLINTIALDPLNSDIFSLTTIENTSNNPNFMFSQYIHFIGRLDFIQSNQKISSLVLNVAPFAQKVFGLTQAIFEPLN
jgi:hypothetical protein